MKKGFTLVEMLGVIVVLALVVTIAYPIVAKNIKAMRESADDSQSKFIIKAAEYWVSDNSHLLPDTDGSSYILTLDTLKSSGYLDSVKQKDLLNDQEFTNACVVIRTVGHRYEYEFKKKCGF